MTDMMADRICGGILGQSSAMVARSSPALSLVPTGSTAVWGAPASVLLLLENIAIAKVRTINAIGIKKMDDPSQGDGPPAAATGAVVGEVVAPAIAGAVVVLMVVMDGPVADVVGAVVMLLQDAAIPASTTANRMAKPETLDMYFPLLLRDRH